MGSSSSGTWSQLWHKRNSNLRKKNLWNLDCKLTGNRIGRTTQSGLARRLNSSRPSCRSAQSKLLSTWASVTKVSVCLCRWCWRTQFTRAKCRSMTRYSQEKQTQKTVSSLRAKKRSKKFCWTRLKWRASCNSNLQLCRHQIRRWHSKSS